MKSYDYFNGDLILVYYYLQIQYIYMKTIEFYDDFRYDSFSLFKPKTRTSNGYAYIKMSYTTYTIYLKIKLYK